MQSRAPEGFLGSRVLAYDRVPWLDSTDIHEDWYFVRDGAALDEIETAALDLHRRAAHDEVASLASAGTAGLYALRIGERRPPSVCYWLSKPKGETYDTFFRRFRDLPDIALWQRKMVLGPTPEFCVESSRPIKGAMYTLKPAVVYPK